MNYSLTQKTRINIRWSAALFATLCIFLVVSSAAFARQGDDAGAIHTANNLEQSQQPNLTNSTLYTQLELLAEVMGYIHNNYPTPIKITQLVEAALKGMLALTDSHTLIISKEELSLLHGDVNITNSDTPPFTFEMIDSQTLYLGINYFHHDIAETIAATIAKNIAASRATALTTNSVKQTSVSNAKELQQLKLAEGQHVNLVLDLRGNPGGYFAEAIKICDLFLSEGEMVRVLGRNDIVLKQHNAHRLGTLYITKVAILIDRESASAAEVVAGVLQARHRATLFGERSFGKGSVQNVITLSDGSGLKLTVAHYLLPGGKPLPKTGLIPDHKTPAANGNADGTLKAAIDFLSR